MKVSLIYLPAGHVRQAHCAPSAVPTCAVKPYEPAAHAHVVHWSGTRKPATISTGSVRDPIERRALAAYMREYRAAERLLQQAHADAQAERARA